jgi:hypothetical protein
MRPFLGVWPASPTRATWDDLRNAIPANRVLGYRPRGGFGQFDCPIVPDVNDAMTMPIYSTNLNPRTGQGDQRQPISLMDWANGVYDSSVLIPAGEQLKAIAPYVRRVIVEIWSECNVQKPTPSPQPKPKDWSTANWEAAFVHTAELWRDMGVPKRVWLGTSVAGVQRGFETYFPPGILEHSQFIGCDSYANDVFKLLSERVTAARSFATANGLPVIITESGVDKAWDYQAWFTDAAAFVRSGGIEGMFYTDFDNTPKGDYRVDEGQPMHPAFVDFSTQAGWRV